MRTIAVLLVFLSSFASGQDKAARPEFDVVDVNPNNSGSPDGSGTILPSGQFRAVNIPIKEIIKFAYNLRDEALIGAPGWVASERYDIVGKAPAAVGSEEIFWSSTSVVPMKSISYNWDETFRQMVQALLADRFKLAVHQEQRELSVFALARALQILAPGYADRTVVDLTGIQGTYDLKLNWVGRANVDQGGLTIPGALEKQLGLRLEGRKLPMSVIVIDHIEMPSEN